MNQSNRRQHVFGFITTLFFCLYSAHAQQSPPEADPQPATSGSEPSQPLPDTKQAPRVNFFETTGIEARSADGSYLMHLWFRGQFRYSYPFDDGPTTVEGFNRPPKSSFDVRRARIKLKGNVFRTWFKYYFEHDFAKNQLLDLRFTLSRYRWLQLRFGQWKVNYNRERADSSGKQQFVERSIVNREFTVDRQPGVMLAGHLWPGRRTDSWYLVGLFNGNGRGASNDNSSMMWFARYQWNFLGRDLPYSQSDVEFSEKAVASFALATVRNRSPYTRFSSAGGGQLDGFEEGRPGQYSLRQYLEEFAFKYHGFSVQQEFHWKEVIDNLNLRTTRLRGTYAQAGLFPWSLAKQIPRPLEFAFRYAWVDPDRSQSQDDRQEVTVAVNWFFSGHDNKLTADFSLLTLKQLGGPELRDQRVRVQWDISF